MTINVLNLMYMNWVTKSGHRFVSSKINGRNKPLVGCKKKRKRKDFWVIVQFDGDQRKAEVGKRFLKNCLILLREKEGRIPLQNSILFNTDSILT